MRKKLSVNNLALFLMKPAPNMKKCQVICLPPTYFRTLGRIHITQLPPFRSPCLFYSGYPSLTFRSPCLLHSGHPASSIQVTCLLYWGHPASSIQVTRLLHSGHPASSI